MQTSNLVFKTLKEAVSHLKSFGKHKKPPEMGAAYYVKNERECGPGTLCYVLDSDEVILLGNSHFGHGFDSEGNIQGDYPPPGDTFWYGPLPEIQRIEEILGEQSDS